MNTYQTGVMMRARRDVGETLIEILVTVVIIGLTVTALLSSLATAGNAGNAQRNSVQADVVMRNYAEATKAGAQGCVRAATYTVVYVHPRRCPVSRPTGNVCPPVATPQLLALDGHRPLGLHETMQIRVSTP